MPSQCQERLSREVSGRSGHAGEERKRTFTLKNAFQDSPTNFHTIDHDALSRSLFNDVRCRQIALPPGRITSSKSQLAVLVALTTSMVEAELVCFNHILLN